MDETTYFDFLTALGEEFCDALASCAGPHGIVPQDGYELFIATFDEDPDPQMLATLTSAQIEQLRAGCEQYIGCQGVTTDHLRLFISRVLARWPADE
jgi:hypothetical protein